MIFTKIWERYFLREVLKVTCLFIFSFYFLYILIDYSSRTSSFMETHFDFGELLTYYYFIFIKRLEILLPFALLIAIIRTLCQLNLHNELVAMLAAGIKMKTILRPFIFVGLLFTGVMYVNMEILIPQTLQRVRIIEDTHFDNADKTAPKRTLPVQSFTLDDDSTLLYQKYDSARDHFFDAYWVRSANDIYRIKYLFPDPDFTIGRFVDHLTRNETGRIEVVESFDTKLFSELHFEKETLMAMLRTPQEMPLSKLWQALPNDRRSLNDVEAQIVTWFYTRLTMPWLCLLAAIGPAPFCMRFTRALPVFLIYALGVFSLVAFYLIMDAAIIFAQGQVLPPAVAIFTPFTLFFGYFGWKFWKTT